MHVCCTHFHISCTHFHMSSLSVSAATRAACTAASSAEVLASPCKFVGFDRMCISLRSWFVMSSNILKASDRACLWQANSRTCAVQASLTESPATARLGCVGGGVVGLSPAAGRAVLQERLVRL